MEQRPIERIAFGPAEAAEAIGIGLTQFRELLSTGAVKSFRLGRRVLVRRRDLEAYIDGLYDAQHAGGAM